MAHSVDMCCVQNYVPSNCCNKLTVMSIVLYAMVQFQFLYSKGLIVFTAGQ